MSGSTPGKGAGVVAVGATGIVATQLPETGANLVNEAAIVALTVLVVWAAAYKLLSRKAA